MATSQEAGGEAAKAAGPTQLSAAIRAPAPKEGWEPKRVTINSADTDIPRWAHVTQGRNLILTPRLKTAFLLLVTAQAAHSSEEYLGRLWEVWAPARFVSVSAWPSNPEVGFLIINICLVTLGLWCYFAVVRRERPGAKGWIWFFVAIESANAIFHVAWAVSNHAYRPGLLTALGFVVLVPVLLGELRLSAQPPPSPA